MNKSIVAIAVAGLVGAVGFSSVASAEATVYGRVTAGAVHTDGDTDANDGAWNFGATGIDGGHGRFNGTRFGFKGSQDLGNGMSAGFQIEREVRESPSANGNNTNVRQRHNLVWLSGSWGKLTLGNQNNPYMNARHWDQTYFYGGNWGASYRHEGINYSMSNGPFSLNVMAMARSENEDDTAALLAGTGASPTTGSVETSGDDGVDAWIVHAGYDFGVVALNVAHHADNKDTDVTGSVAGAGGNTAEVLAANNAAADGASRDRTAIGVNGSVGPMDWYLAYETSELNASGSGFEDNDTSSVGGFVGFSASDKDTLYGYYVAHSADRAVGTSLGEDYTETILGYSRDIGPGVRFIAEYQSLDQDTDADGSDPSKLALAVRYVF